VLAVAMSIGGDFVTGPAHADASAEDDQKARELFRLAESHYAAGRYEKAAVLYDEAYRLSGRPDLLLALVNTYERIGNYGLAVDKLKQYLDHPRAKNQAALRDRLQRLEATDRERMAERLRLEQLEQDRVERLREQEEQAKTTALVQSLAAPEEPELPSAEESESVHLPGYLLLGGGMASLAAALGLGLVARNAGDDAEQHCGDQLCEAGAQDLLEREFRYAVASDVCLGVGIASAAVGAFLLWKRRRGDGGDGSVEAVTLHPVRGGIGAAATF
jgi:tetratricopeptide (TPR) repeat protein